MNNLASRLAMAAAVTLVSAGGAMASTATISLDGYCDVLTFTLSQDSNTGKNTIAAMSEPSSCTADLMAGFEVKIPGYKNKWVSVGGPRFGDGTDAWGFLVQYPFKTGGAWGLYESTDGVNNTLIASGTYTVSGGAVHLPGVLPAGKAPQQPVLQNRNLPVSLHW